MYSSVISFGGVHGHDGAEVHWVHVGRRTGHERLGNQPDGTLSWVKSIPECIHLSVWA